jgi:hypothetical protein
MSDIRTDEEPEDIADQLLPGEIEAAEERERTEEAGETTEAERLEEEAEREREAEKYEREEERGGEQLEYEPPTDVEADLNERNLGADYGYVVYYSKPH